MYKFISSQLVSLNDSTVLSFDFNSNVKEYSFGFIDPVINKTINELHVYKNKIISINSQGENVKEQNNKTIIYNVQDFLLGNTCVIKQQSTPQYIIKTSNSMIQFYDRTNSDKTSLRELNLNYTCFSTDSFFTMENQFMYNINGQFYYKSNLPITPVIIQSTQKKDYDVVLDENEIINIGQNNLDLIFLAIDYEVTIPTNYIEKMYSIVSVQQGKIIKTDYSKGITDIYSTDGIKMPRRARFVISDYGRMISHSFKENDKYQYKHVSVNTFDTQKTTNPVTLVFQTDNDAGISNISSNF